MPRALRTIPRRSGALMELLARRRSKGTGDLAQRLLPRCTQATSLQSISPLATCTTGFASAQHRKPFGTPSKTRPSLTGHKVRHTATSRSSALACLQGLRLQRCPRRSHDGAGGARQMEISLLRASDSQTGLCVEDLRQEHVEQVGRPSWSTIAAQYSTACMGHAQTTSHRRCGRS